MPDILVLLNARAGALLSGGAQVRAALHESLGDRAEIRLLRPRAMPRAIAQAAHSDFDTVVVGGGDGSVNCAAQAFAGTDKTLGVLPCGTMNLFARDLGMPQDPLAAAQCLAQTAPRLIDLGSVNGRPFHSLSGLGFFSQMARAREEARDLPGRLLRVGAAALRAFARSGRFSLSVAIDGRRREIDTYAVLVTCNRFSGADWRRRALDGGELEIHIAEDEGALARLQAAADLVSGEWRDNPGILSVPAQEIRIGSLRPRAWVSSDGELRRERTPLDYAIRRKALRVLGLWSGKR